MMKRPFIIIISVLFAFTLVSCTKNSPPDVSAFESVRDENETEIDIFSSLPSETSKLESEGTNFEEISSEMSSESSFSSDPENSQENSQESNLESSENQDSIFSSAPTFGYGDMETEIDRT